MKQETFLGILTGRFNACSELLQQKGEEYSSDTDRLHNFKVAAAMCGNTPEQALWGMMAKHLVSIKDMVDDTINRTSDDMVDEKISDAINYLVLLEALFKENIDD